MKNIKTISTKSQVVISDTGEVVDEIVNKIQVYLDKDKFALVYASFWDTIMETNLSKSDLELGSYLIKNYGKGVPFSITRNIKEELCKITKKSITSYNNSVKNLLEAGFIYKVGNRSYKINPTHAFEGSSSTRKKAIIEMFQECIG